MFHTGNGTRDHERGRVYIGRDIRQWKRGITGIHSEEWKKPDLQYSGLIEGLNSLIVIARPC